jgi:uncharacterized protein YjbI with pentapeptide repeats
VKLAGATGWVPADRDLREAKLKGADLQGADLQAVSLSNADLSVADLKRSNMSISDLSGAKLIGADLSGCNLAGATLPRWSSGLMEGVKLAGETGWVPEDRDLRKAKLKGADLEGADLEGVSLSDTDLRLASQYWGDLFWNSPAARESSGSRLRNPNLFLHTVSVWRS